MKKAYSKPQIVFESFELTTSIAAGCSIILSKEDIETEKSWDPGLFTDEMNCSSVDCYHVPSNSGAIFTS